MDQQIRTASGLAVLFSLWLIVSPFVLSFAGSTGMWDAVVVGVIVLVLAWIRYANPLNTSALSWLVALLGVWLIVSPYVFGMSGVTRLLWDYFVCGAAFIVFGAWAALARPAATM
jgi:hypothetical protein